MDEALSAAQKIIARVSKTRDGVHLQRIAEQSIGRLSARLS